MLLRATLSAALLATASTAPMQCGHTPEAELQEDETPGDALWQLAQRFKAAGDAGGEKRTLEYLVERYPASRWVSPAREELGKLGGVAVPAPSTSGSGS